MGKVTDIEWCDSTLNLQMGCDGCELWNSKRRSCYAGILVERYGGKNSGFPEAFDEPKLYPERLDAALRWPDLTGKPRPGKPWLDGMPRLIFLDDMGDTFTESLPLEWLAPVLPRMADSPHQFLCLTKRANRMREFSQRFELPANFWPGTSLTTQQTQRVKDLFAVRGGGPKFISAEPLLAPIDFDRMDLPWNWEDQLAWLIAGGESGAEARPMHPDWVRSLRGQCHEGGIPFFFKQWGEWLPICEMTTEQTDALYRSNRVAKEGQSQADLDDIYGRTCTVPTEGMQFDGRFGWNGGDPFHIPYQIFRVGKKAAGRTLDGREWSQFPAAIRTEAPA